MKKSQEPASFDSFTEDESPGFLDQNVATQTIDIGWLSDEGLTHSGSFDFRDLGRTVVGKLLQSLPLPAAVINESGEVLFVNQAWHNFIPDHDRMLSFSFFSLLPSPSASEQVKLLARESLITRKTKTIESVIKIGNLAKWGRMTFRPLRFRAERSLLLLVEDLTLKKKQVLLGDKHRKELEDYNKRLRHEVQKRKQVEEELRVRERQFRQLVENAHDIIYQTDAKGFFTLVNPAAGRVIGYSREGLLGKHYLELIHPEFRDQTWRFYGRQFEERVPDTYYECPVLAHDGRVVWLGQHAHLLTDGDTIAGFQSVARDITDRKRDEEKIREQNEFLTIVLESLTHPFYVVNAVDHTIEMANSAAVRSGIVQGATCYSAVHGRACPCSGQEHPCPAEEIKKTRQPVEMEHVHTMPTGESRHVEIHAYPLDAEGSVSRFIEYSLDVTDRKKAEELLLQTARFRAVADLASGVAHNFNNLLQIVIGSANLAMMNLQSGEFSDMKENLERILDSSQFGAETVRRLNRFSRTQVEEDASSITEVFDLSDLVSQAVEMTRPWWKTHPEQKGIRVDLKTMLEDGCMVEGRKNEIFEVLVNLIKNATEALPNGGAISIQTRLKSDHVILGVRDTGVGIPEKNLDRVFTPFFTTNVEVGRGLGLATARRIVDEHGGLIAVRSTEGRGTLFALRLPLVRATPELAAIPPTSIQDKPISILVIDDMEAMVGMLRDGLEAFGHTAFTALSGEEGLAIFRDNPVDLVICDLGMPGMNGWEVGKAIKDFCLERHIPKPPFVILTGWSDQSGETEKIAESGVDRVIQKPIDILRLLEGISPLVQKD